MLLTLILLLSAPIPALGDRKARRDERESVEHRFDVRRVFQRHDGGKLVHGFQTFDRWQEDDFDGYGTFIFEFDPDPRRDYRGDAQVRIERSGGHLIATLHREGKVEKAVEVTHPRGDKTAIRFPSRWLARDLASYRWKFEMYVPLDNYEPPCCGESVPEDGKILHRL